MIELPKSYWNIWCNGITTIFASIRVSGFHAGIKLHQNHAKWLQRYDRRQLIYYIENQKKRVLNLS